MLKSKVSLTLIGLFILITLSSFTFGSIYDDNIAYWSFDNDTFSTNEIEDLTGNGYTAENNGATYTQGILGDALTFDGSNDWVNLEYINGTGNYGVLGNQEEICISYWVKDAEENNKAYISDYCHGDAGWCSAGNIYTLLLIRDSSSATSMLFGTNDHTDWWSTTEQITDSQYVHHVWSYDGKNLYFWEDGILKSTGTSFGGTTHTGQETLLDIGRHHSNDYYDYQTISAIDELSLYRKNCTPSDISELYQTGTGYNPYPIPAETITITLNSPANDTYSDVVLNANYTYENSLGENGTCLLYVNGVNIISQNNTDVLNGSTQTILSTMSEGEHTWYINCTSDNVTATVSDTRTYIYDVSTPVIVTNFVNGSVGYDVNITGQFNFTDNVLLHSLNVSIDGTTFYNITGINNDTYQYNFSADILNDYGIGKHILSVEVADGHTAKKLIDADAYNANNGIFNDRVEYNFKNPYKNLDLKIANKDKSVFDKWSVIKKVDRYSEVFEPNTPSDSYTLLIQSTEKIFIVDDKQGRYGGTWLIVDNHWKDFVVKDRPNVKPTFNRIDDFNIEVTLNGLGGLEVIEFESTGDLNILEKNYTMYGINFTETYTSYLVDGFSSAYSLVGNTGDLLLTSLVVQLTANATTNTATQSYLNTSGFGATKSLTFESDTTQVIPHNWTITGAATDVPSFSFTTTTQNQTLYNIQLAICNASINNTIINFTYYNEVTKASINITNTFNLYFDDGIVVHNLSGTLVNNATDSICTNLDPSVLSFGWSMYGEMILEKTDYITKVYTIPSGEPISVSNNNPPNLDLFMIAVNDSTTIQFKWMTTQFVDVDGTMKIYECVGDGTRILVDSVPIINGVCYGNLQLLTQSYSYDVVSEDILYYDIDSFSKCHIESATERTYYITLSGITIDDIVGLNTLSCKLTKNNDTSVKMVWESNSGADGYVNGCIKQTVTTIQGSSTFYENCSVESDGYSKIFDLSIDDNVYNVQATVQQDGNVAQCDGLVTFSPTTNAQSAWGITGLLATFFIVAFVLLVFAGEGELMLGSASVGLIVALILGMLYLPWMTVASMLAFIAIIIVIGRYSRKK